MKRAPLILLAIVVASPLAAFTAMNFYLDEASLRARAEAAVLKATGREMRIAGPIRLAWSLTPAIEARDITLANPPGFSRPDMAHVDRIQANVALLPLLSRRVEVTGVVVTGPDVLFERDAQGRPNWETPKPPPSAAPAAPSESGRRFAVDVSEVTILDAKLAWRGGQLIELAAPRLTYDPAAGRLAGDVTFRGNPLHLVGTASPPALQIEGSGLKLALSGTPAATTLVADVSDLSSLSAVAGATLPPLRNVHLETKATIGPASLTLDGLKLTSAQGDLAGNLVLTGNARPALRGALTSTRLDIDSLLPAPATTQIAPAPPPPAAPPSPRASGPVIPDTPINYGELRKSDVDLQFNAAAIAWHGHSYTNVGAHIVQQDGTLRLNPVSMALGDKTLAADVRADAAAQTVGVTVAAPGLPAAPVLALLGVPAASGTLDLRADLHGQGATWRAVGASLQGNAGLAMVDGEIDNAWLLDKMQDALRAANIPLPTGGDSKVRCAALRIDAEGGKMRLQTLTFDSSKLSLEGSGDIDLAGETLDLHLRPTLRLGAALSVPIHVGGTFRAPKTALDPGAISPGRVGISIGGPAPPDGCGPALALARGGEAGPAPAPPPANRSTKPADLLRGLLR